MKNKVKPSINIDALDPTGGNINVLCSITGGVVGR